MGSEGPPGTVHWDMKDCRKASEKVLMVGLFHQAPGLTPLLGPVLTRYSHLWDERLQFAGLGQIPFSWCPEQKLCPSSLPRILHSPYNIEPTDSQVCMGSHCPCATGIKCDVDLSLFLRLLWIKWGPSGFPHTEHRTWSIQWVTSETKGT